VTRKYGDAGDAIVAFARLFAEKIRDKCEDDPRTELTVWLTVALQREAFVTKTYRSSHLTRRLRAVREQEHGHAPEIADLVERGVRGVWAQERRHTRWLDDILASCQEATWFTRTWKKVRGKLEGMGTAAATSVTVPSAAVGRLVMQFGSLVMRDVPELANLMRQVGMKDFFLFNAAVEETALAGYQRMVSIVENYKLLFSEFPLVDTLAYDLAQIGKEENFHRALFLMYSEWFAPTNALSADVTAAAAKRCGRDLVQRWLPTSMIRAKAAKATKGGRPGKMPPRFLVTKGLEGFLDAIDQPHRIVDPRALSALRRERRKRLGAAPDSTKRARRFS